MNKNISNKKFWEDKGVIDHQNQIKPKAHGYEKYLYDLALDYVKSNDKEVENIKVFGCGTGRELPEINNTLKPNYIKATDISNNMIDGCEQNIKYWGIDDIVETEVIAAEKFKSSKFFNVVTIMTSMLTYVPNKNDRKIIFDVTYSILEDNGVVVGVVHNQVGKFNKTIYFKLRKLFSLFIKGKPGERKSGFKGYKVPAYYFTRNELKKELSDANFKNIDVFSLEDYCKRQNQKYNRKKGDNNLLFFATR